MEAVINQLPQFVPAVSQFDAGNTFAGSQRTPGAATLSLRGLGSNRNLVLLDGRRAMPINASMAVSINTIPSAAIARIETITGGASSVYGADAVAGVVNFITKRDFEGIDFDVQTGQTMEEDGEEYRVSGLFGANLADGRGNVMLGFERSVRDEIRRVDREFFRGRLHRPLCQHGRVLLVRGGVYGQQRESTFPGFAERGLRWADLADHGSTIARTGTFYMNPDGTLYKTTANSNLYVQRRVQSARLRPAVAEARRRHRQFAGESTHQPGADSARTLFDIRPRPYGRFGSRPWVCSAPVQRELRPGRPARIRRCSAVGVRLFRTATASMRRRCSRTAIRTLDYLPGGRHWIELPGRSEGARSRRYGRRRRS